MFKNELEKLANERETVRVKEQNLLDEVEKMESQLLEREQYFNQEKAKETAAAKVDLGKSNVNMKEIREQEMVYANQRAGQVAKIRAERDRLEREKFGIMDKLSKIQISA